MEEINSAKRWMNQLEQKIAEGDSSDKTLNDLATAQERFASAGGWTQDQDVDVVLKGLGFLPTDSDRLCSDFSGGWKMRIGLAKLLLSKPDLLLLDEPSNHLVSCTIHVSEKYLTDIINTLSQNEPTPNRTRVHEIGWQPIYPIMMVRYSWLVMTFLY